MVYGFLLLPAKPAPWKGKSSDAKGKSKTSSEPVVTWATRFYDSEGNNKWSCARAKAIAKRVRQEFSVASADMEKEEQGMWTRTATDPEEKRIFRGAFRLPRGKMLSKPKVILWLHKKGVIGTIICEDHVNVLLAANQLELLMNSITEHYGPDVEMSAKLVNEKPEELHMLLDRFLPCGHLQFLSESDVKKELAELAIVLHKQS
mmetsp:Transcript_32378/g.45143  ORF Transcript_32378/g.45143 Transcript_32378/m.45143 type:complete len:204 (+) Transcript_32378:164-775(+)